MLKGNLDSLLFTKFFVGSDDKIPNTFIMRITAQQGLNTWDCAGSITTFHLFAQHFQYELGLFRKKLLDACIQLGNSCAVTAFLKKYRQSAKSSIRFILFANMKVRFCKLELDVDILRINILHLFKDL